MRCLIICTALLLLLANGAYAGGTYQRTKDGKTLVWNNYPTPGEVATWSGDRDKDGYATGKGTLTWRTPGREPDKPTVVNRYTGIMVQGKLEGVVVNVEANGKTFRATFAKGKQRSDWTIDPAPGGLEKQREEPVRRDASIEAPAEGPAPIRDQPASRNAAAPAATETQGPVSDSLRSLAAPPASLRTNADAPIQESTASSPSTSPRLTTAEVTDLADAEARTQGYDLGEYQRSEAHYTAADGTWSVSYDQKFVGETGKHFSVNVEDKTKKTSTAGR